MSIKLFSKFPWPALSNFDQCPAWTGVDFIVSNNQRKDVLIYDEAESHWSEELTLVHESEAGEGDHPIDIASRRLATQSLRRHISGSASVVLDAGCSSGFFIRDLINQRPELSVMGADYISGPLHRLSKIIPGVPLLQFDLRKCPLPDNCIDAVVCLNVLEHIDKDTEALKEIYRILKPGGIAHIEVPSGPSCYDIYDEFLMHHRRYTMQELTVKAKGAGFSVVTKTHLGCYLFPAFYITKKRNQGLLLKSAEEKSILVKKMMRNTRKSALVDIVIKIELIFGRLLRYPFGIRCVAVLKKN